MTRMAEWKLGIIGAGSISESHMEAISREKRVRLCGIADLNEETARARVSRFGSPAVYRDYREMLAQESLDGVILCLPNHLHEQVAVEAMDAGCHVLCEKPLSIDVASARRMAAYAHRTGKTLMVAQNNRFRADAQLLKTLLSQHRLGPIYHAKTGWIRRSGIPGWGSWFTNREQAGGGPLIDIGVHMLDLTLWLLDFPRPVSVFGQTYDRFGPRKKGLSSWGTIVDHGRFDVEDAAVALIRLEGGRTIHLDVSWAAHTAGDRTYVDLWGDEGGAALDLNRHRLHLYEEAAGVPVDAQMSPLPQHDRFHLLTHWVRVMEGVEEPICTAEQGIDVLRILEAIYQSSRTGEAVRLDEEQP